MVWTSLGPTPSLYKVSTHGKLNLSTWYLYLYKSYHEPD